MFTSQSANRESKLPEGRVELGCVRGINEEKSVVDGKKLQGWLDVLVQLVE
ncbi:hypothetical protein TGAMA5MH_06008 [Trichoderma gamsii]|uniref:Uncharacterized protein n=1 Tax=Trichoderma gamsii TaxID=398673 RepID=A0A2K0T9X2_9HYPO|nr:hypothetical protein TGAMA5MH_06008 [Trichoderma gamsii]